MKPSKSSKTPLMTLLRRAFHDAITNNEENLQTLPSEVDNTNTKWNRRQFLQTSAQALVAGSLVVSFPIASCKRNDLGLDAEIVIVGAGIAGLNTAWQLQKKGITATIYEASNRIGGRMFSERGFFGTGTVTELGGEFIDSNHKDLLQLTSEFGLQLLDTATDNQLTKDAYFFNGRHYTVAQVISELRGITPRMQADINLYKSNYDRAVATLDKKSLEQYLNEIGATGWLKSLLIEAYVTEYGLDAGEQSCLNMLSLISLDTSKGTFEIFGDSDERYKIVGGNDGLTNRMAGRLSNSINTDHRLVALAKSGNRYKVTFERSGGSVIEVPADIVVLTLPFTLLREVSLNSNLKLPPQKLKAIRELGYGTNAKLMLGFNNRPWRNNGYTGYLFTDNGLQSGWENTQLQNTSQSSYTIFLGGTLGVGVGAGTPESQSNQFLPKLNQVFPNAQSSYNNKVARFHWPTSPFAKCSYACYKVGQWGSIAGWESEPVGNLLFAGEHCSEEFQGYMNGAAETGRLAAEKILDIIQ